jgi:hypothetical protein
VLLLKSFLPFIAHCIAPATKLLNLITIGISAARELFAESSGRNYELLTMAQFFASKAASKPTASDVTTKALSEAPLTATTTPAEPEASTTASTTTTAAPQKRRGGSDDTEDDAEEVAPASDSRVKRRKTDESNTATGYCCIA